MMEQKGEKVKRYMSEGLLEIPSGDSQGKPEDSKEWLSLGKLRSVVCFHTHYSFLFWKM